MRALGLLGCLAVTPLWAEVEIDKDLYRADVDAQINEMFDHYAYQVPGPRVGLGITTMSIDGPETFIGEVDDRGDDAISGFIEWHVPIRNYSQPHFGFYVSAGLAMADYEFEGDAAAVAFQTYGVRLTAGYGLRWDTLNWEIGLLWEHGISRTNDFELNFTEEFTGRTDLYLKIGVQTSMFFDVFGPQGLAVGWYGQIAHQRIRLAYDFVRITAAGKTIEPTTATSLDLGLIVKYDF